MAGSAKKPADRKAELAEALRANLKRRKAQVREKARDKAKGEGAEEAPQPGQVTVEKDTD